MSIKKMNPYLMFNGTAEKAIKLYEAALGAKTEHLQRFSEVPGSKESSAGKDRVIHALLRIGDDPLMISDSQVGSEIPIGSNVRVCLDFADAADMQKKFDALAAHGKVELAVHDTFWGAKFGILVDALGVCWMFNCTLKS